MGEEEGLRLEQVLVRVKAPPPGGSGHPGFVHSKAAPPLGRATGSRPWADQPCSIPLPPNPTRQASSAARPSPPRPFPLLLPAPLRASGGPWQTWPHCVPGTEAAEC